MATIKRIRYFDAESGRPPEQDKRAVHSEFLRNGHITRFDDQWVARNRRYLSHEQVAALTGRKLEDAGRTTHRRLNDVTRAIRFPEIIRHHTLDAAPHLGYCHVTAARTDFRTRKQVMWSFYLANFFSEIGAGDEGFFTRIDTRYSRMYFAVTVNKARNGNRLVLDRDSVRPDGLLFMTPDPQVAMKNVLMLGARSPELRKAIAAL